MNLLAGLTGGKCSVGAVEQLFYDGREIRACFLEATARITASSYLLMLPFSADFCKALEMANQAESSQDWAEERWAIDAKEKSMATESNKLARWCGRVDVVLILGAICRLREKKPPICDRMRHKGRVSETLTRIIK